MERKAPGSRKIPFFSFASKNLYKNPVFDDNLFRKSLPPCRQIRINW